MTTTTTFGGAFLVLLGLLGFAVPQFLGLHLSPLHNAVFVVSGLWSIYFGLKATREATRTLCLVLSGLYGLLAVAGFVFGGSNYALTIIPGALVLGAMDHVVHLMVSGAFLSFRWGRSAIAAKPRKP